MLVEIWSDVVCPWCYVGKRRFETALARCAETVDVSSIEVVYRPYQLDPTAPAGSATPVAEVYARKFGGTEQAQRIFDHLTEVGRGDGLDFRFDLAVRSNTLLAHQALWMAEHEEGADQAAVKERLMAAYFTEGLNVGDPEVVAHCATAGGMQAADVLARLDAGEGRAEVTEWLATAAGHGITAVPTYVFDGAWAVPGAQDVDVFVRVLERRAATSAEDSDG